MFEIGCGAARVTKALARLFGEVNGVDAGGEMIRLPARSSRTFRTHTYIGTMAWACRCADLPFDFAFSTIVSQHIPSPSIIENYICETARLLRPGGLCAGTATS